MFYNLLHTPFGHKPETQLFCRRMYVVWVNSHLQGSCSHLLSSFGKRAGIQIPSRSYLLGDNSTNDSSVDKAGPFISLLPDLIQGPARDDALVSLDTAPCPQGLPALQTLCRTLQTLQCLQTGRALSNCQAHQFELNVGHPSMMHTAKNVKAVPPASLQPSSIPPGLHFPGAESPLSLCSCKKLSPLCCCCCLHDLTSCSTKGDTANVQMKLLQMKYHQGTWHYLIVLIIRPWFSAVYHFVRLGERGGGSFSCQVSPHSWIFYLIIF